MNRRRLTSILLLRLDVKLVIGLDKGHPLLDGAAQLAAAKFDVTGESPSKTYVCIRVDVDLSTFSVGRWIWTWEADLHVEELEHAGIVQRKYALEYQHMARVDGRGFGLALVLFKRIDLRISGHGRTHTPSEAAHRYLGLPPTRISALWVSREGRRTSAPLLQVAQALNEDVKVDGRRGIKVVLVRKG